MLSRRSCGLLLTCLLAAARPAMAQDVAGPRTYELTLEQALELARTRGPAVRRARAQVGEARGRLAGASVLLRDNPTLEVGGGPRFGSRSTTPDLDVGLGQVFELGGQRRARIDAARADIDRAATSVDETSRRLLRDVATTFLRALHAEERLWIATETERLATEIERIAKRRHEAGDVGLLDVHLSTLTLARVQSEVQTAQATRDRSIGELRVRLGLEPNAAVSVRGDILDRRRYELRSLLARAPERPDLRALEASTRQAGAEARLGKARAWPDLGLRVGYAREEGDEIVQGTLTFTLPVFDRGQGLKAAAQAREKTLRIAREAAEIAVRAEIRVAYETYQRLGEAVERFERTGRFPISQTDSLARLSYKAGAMPLAELLAVRRELVDARVTYADLLLNAALAGVELEAAAGVLR